jgi:hypothetical protein
MSRIRIEDLPPADENLTPEELEQIEGAGRPSFRPSLEGLEGREMYAVNLGNVLPGGLPGTALVRQIPLLKEMQIQHKEELGTKTFLQGDDYSIQVRTFKDGNETVHAIEVRRIHGAQQVFYALEGPDHRYTVITTVPGQAPVTRKYDVGGFRYEGEAAGGKLRFLVATVSGETKHVEAYEGFDDKSDDKAILVSREIYDNKGILVSKGIYRDGKLVSRYTFINGVKAQGVLRNDGKWEVTTTGTLAVEGFTKRVEVFDKVDGKLLSRNTTNMKFFLGDKHLSTVLPYVQELWFADGGYHKHVWKKEAHGPEGSNDHISRTVISNGMMIVTGYHLKGNTVYNGALAAESADATVTWTYQLNADNTIKSLAGYQAIEGNWSASWSPGGWSEWYPRQYGAPVFPPPVTIPDGIAWKGWETQFNWKGQRPIENGRWRVFDEYLKGLPQ